MDIEAHGLSTRRTSANKALLSDKFPLRSKFAAERGVMSAFRSGCVKTADHLLV